MKNITIKQQEYFDKKDILIEVSEEIVVEPVNKVNVYSVGNLEATITELENRRRESNKKFDAEIQSNKSILDTVRAEIEAVVITQRPKTPTN